MPSIIHIETLVPNSSYNQTQVSEIMQELIEDKKAHQYIQAISQDSGIDQRHSVISDFRPEAQEFFLREDSGKALEPSTKQRNDIYTKQSKQIIKKLATQLTKNCPEFDFQEITHVITVSCTGFYNPGPDLDLIQALDLPDSTERYHLGFMGCYAALPALKMADQFCTANPKANVLVLCLELCSLHFQLKSDLDTIIANSIFADGAAAVIVSNKTINQPRLAIENFNSSFLPQGKDDMAWSIGNNGFDMILSKYVSRIIGANISEITNEYLTSTQLEKDDINLWAIHPGGKSILDKAEEALAISTSQIKASRETLRKYGNMSSATILFVLKEIISNQVKDQPQNVTAMAFGPGLVIESALLSLINN